MPQKVEIIIDCKSIELPVLEASEGVNVIDVRGLIKEGMFTYDPGFLSTASCESKITYIDGDSGFLIYRGYPIEQLAENSSHLEVCYLLLNGELPNQKELDKFNNDLTYHTLIHEDMKHFFEGFSTTAHPMVILSSMVSSLSAYYSEASGAASVDQLEVNTARLMAKIRTIAAFSYKKSIGQPFIYPQDKLAYCANFLNMMFAVPAEPYEVDPEITKALDLLLILHACLLYTSPSPRD